MSQAEQTHEWYLARDGQQHGPISAAEMEKIIELSYLLPTDLVWRQGFTDWLPAAEAFPKPSDAKAVAPALPPPASASGASAQGRTDDRKGDRTSISKDPASWEAEARRQQASLQRGDAAGRNGGAQGTPEAADRTAGTREVIAAEAARREEAARRARESAAGKPITAPPANRLAAPGSAARAEPLGRTDAISPGRTPQPGPSSGDDGIGGEDDAWADETPRPRVPKFAIAAVLLLALIGGGVYALHAAGQLDPLVSRISTASIPQPATPPVVSASREIAKQPQGDYASNPTEVDRQFQRSALWQLLKAEFPEWYQERVRDAARQKGEGKADKAIAQHLAEQLVALRRKHVTDALAASPQNLKSVASTFLDNLERLSKHSTDACYGFISQGETNPLIVELSRTSEHTPALQRQAAAIFKAIAEGRRTPAQHRQPTREDYDQLAMQLAKRGWSPSDLQLFSDARSLARATPERVCRMVQDWFAAQLAVSDEDVQVRLLIEALKPVVAG